MPRKLSHLDARGRVRMVDVGAKPVTKRVAVARGRVRMAKETLAALEAGSGAKGNVLATAHLAGVLAAKRTDTLIPLAHTVPLDAVTIDFEPDRRSASLRIEARVSCRGRTGVEMEALTAVSVAALTIYDMLKAIDRGMEIGEIALWEKRGGRSGTYRRP
jgi:cyclic pyranopterin phosphate synthase